METLNLILRRWIPALVTWVAVELSGSTLESIHDFQRGPGSPAAGLILASDGALYGTTTNGGAFDLGAVFKLTTNGIVTTLASFDGTNGSSPQGALVEANDGLFYGTTYAGGSQKLGTVFKVSPRGALTTIVSFAGTNGSKPRCALIQGHDGNFYGTTTSDAHSGYGTVFGLSTNGVITTLHSFTGSDGYEPRAGLVQLRGLNFFYGSTYSGGGSLPNNYGTLFLCTPSGALVTLVRFAGTNGSNPSARMIEGSDGNLYGTTQGGGAYGRGTAFQMTSDGVLTTLHSFDLTSSAYSPTAGLTESGNGEMYGTASAFEGAVLYSLNGTAGFQVITNFGMGSVMNGELTVSNDGILYGLLRRVFLQAFALDQGNRIEVIARLSDSGGRIPSATLLSARDGSLYGTTRYGGPFDRGTVFKTKIDGSFMTLASFDGTNGAGPLGTLVQDNTGNVYGTANSGGAAIAGTVFTLATNGVLSPLVSFGGTNGAGPVAGLIRAPDGSFYGTTSAGGDNGQGTVFRITPAGDLSTLFSLTDTNGSYAVNGVTLGQSQGLFINTISGGSDGKFARLEANGEITNWITLPGAATSAPVLGRDGDFYAVTTGERGQVIRITSNGLITTQAPLSNPDGTFPLGSGPYSGLFQSSDGDFFGAAYTAGPDRYGTVFRMAPDGTLSLAASFDRANGANPVASLVTGGDGNLYGTTTAGGSGGGGTIYRLLNTPRLRITESADDAILSWSALPAGFVLETSPDLAAPDSWIAAPYSTVTNGHAISVRIPAAIGNQFYRLRFE